MYYIVEAYYKTDSVALRLLSIVIINFLPIQNSTRHGCRAKHGAAAMADRREKKGAAAMADRRGKKTRFITFLTKRLACLFDVDRPDGCMDVFAQYGTPIKAILPDNYIAVGRHIVFVSLYSASLSRRPIVVSRGRL